MIDLQTQEGVFVLRMTSGENRFNLPFLDALDAALDEVERAPAPIALMTVGDACPRPTSRFRSRRRWTR